MRVCNLLVATLFCLGVVDVIEGNMATVEFKTDGQETYHADMPIELFPCEVSEGSHFYAEIIDGVTEIRCGEPPL
jgi:hypothetical protein